MLDWFSERFADLLNTLPDVLVNPGSPTFEIMRGMLGLVILALVIVLLALWPSRWFKRLVHRGRQHESKTGTPSDP